MKTCKTCDRSFDQQPCDKCGSDFYPRKVERVEVEEGEDKVFIHTTCPSCLHNTTPEAALHALNCYFDGIITQEEAIGKIFTK